MMNLDEYYRRYLPKSTRQSLRAEVYNFITKMCKKYKLSPLEMMYVIVKIFSELENWK